MIAIGVFWGTEAPQMSCCLVAAEVSRERGSIQAAENVIDLCRWSSALPDRLYT
jgi:hypothetical protein